MKVKLWGVRGSLPTPIEPAELEEKMVKSVSFMLREGLHAERDVREYIAKQPLFLHRTYGGNTTCVQVTSQKQTIMIDAGSGIRALAQTMKKVNEFHILFTHFHWDHLIGLMFFVPMFRPSATIHFYAVQPELEQVIRTMFKKPFFPVPFDELPAKIHFHTLDPRQPK